MLILQYSEKFLKRHGEDAVESTKLLWNWRTGQHIQEGITADIRSD